MARMVSRKDTQNQLILLYQKKKKFSPPKILLDKYKCCTCILMTSVYTLYSTSSNKEKKFFFFWLLMQLIYYFRWNWGQRILIQWGISHQNAKYSPKSTKIKNLHLLRYFATKKITVNLYVYMFIITCKSFLFPFILTLLYYSNM